MKNPGMRFLRAAQTLTLAVFCSILAVDRTASAQDDPSGIWQIVEPTHVAPGRHDIPEHTWTLTITRQAGVYRVESGPNEPAKWNIEIRPWDFVLRRPWTFRGNAPERVRNLWQHRKETHEIRLALSADGDNLTGQRNGYWIRWNEQGDITELEAYKHEVTATRLPPPTPADLYRHFLDLQMMLQILADGYRNLPDSGFDAPPEGLRALQYRIDLISHYLRIHELFENQTPLERPGPPDPLKPGPKPLSHEDLFVVANAYLGLLQEPVPSETAIFWTGVKWRDTSGKPLYFSTAHEGEVLRTVLTFQDIKDQRARVRRRLMMAAELTIGVTNLLPGGAIPELTLVATTGRSVYGDHVGFFGRVLALGAIALELAPVAIPAVRAGINSAGRRLPQGMQEELMRYLTDRNTLRSRIDGTAGGAVAREQIQADWLRHYDAGFERRTSGIPISAETIAKDGIPIPARGIDHYAYPAKSVPGANGIVRELKLKQKFSGTWSRSETSLNNIQVRSVGEKSIRDAINQAGGAAQVDQLSWPWILDRAIRGHRRAVQVGAHQEAAAARDLIQRFTNGQLTRQLCIMTDAGEVFSRAGTLTGPKANALSSFIDDIVPTPVLQNIAKEYLRTAGN